MIKTDLGWTKYILDKLDTKTEIFDGNPTCPGLARVFEAEFGKILSKRIRIDNPPNMTLGMEPADVSATVVCTLTYTEYPVVIDEEGGEKHYQTFDGNQVNIETLCPIEVESGVDTRAGLLPEPFDQHLVSSIDTRAFSRALKLAMGLNCLTAEELQKNDTVRTISPVKIDVISNLCQELGINIDAFLTTEASCTSRELKNLSDANGEDLIEKIRQYESKELTIPKEIKK